MAEPILRQIFRRWQRGSAASYSRIISTMGICEQRNCYATAAAINVEKNEKEMNNQWLVLPPFTPTADGSAIGKQLSGKPAETKMTALKWILVCCPNIPRSLVQKLFRLRQIRKESTNTEIKEQRPRRVGAKDLMDTGDRIFLPKSVDAKSSSSTENQNLFSEEELKFVQSLEIYKDPAIIVINKPPGMPVQGGVGISRSIDELAAKYLRYDYKESPRLVHRLDRDSSGILVMGRTQLSTTILHSIFREKTLGRPNDVLGCKGILRKRYWALVIGCPRRREGSISAPLVKVVVDNGKSERITIADMRGTLSGQHAMTKYRVVASSPSGYSWLELSPHTGRKHQLRVHCAEVLGTPIVGDYKYGWRAHKKLGHLLDSATQENVGLELESGSISDKHFRLHLHCKEMVLPNISMVLQNGNITDLDAAQIETVWLDAPLPAHMRRSWGLLK